MVTKHARSFVDEFQKFAFKGNVVDLAVGVIIGGAFGKIVDSLVKHIIMPTVSVMMPGEQSYTDWAWTIGEQTVPYGQFLGEVVNFLIVALALFVFIRKFLGWIMKWRQEPQPVVIPQLTKDQELLVQIRDILQQRAE